jgi:endonuclease/exonuclease/phosphatase family metal-dependent hydrolase
MRPTACSSPTGTPPTTPGPFSLRILTLNTHKGFTLCNRRFVLPELRDAIRSTAADVVFLQEVLGSHAKHATRHAAWPAAPQYEFLADGIWTQFAYGQNAVYPEGHHGNALLSRYPIVAYENLDVSAPGRAERRGLLHCTIAAPGQAQAIHAICVHFGLTEPHRRAQAELLCRRVEEAVPASAPLVVAGDFNDWRLEIHALLYERSGLQEGFAVMHGAVARTFPARMPLLRLDRVYLRHVRPRIAQRLSARPWSHLSDHASLVVEVQL